MKSENEKKEEKRKSKENQNGKSVARVGVASVAARAWRSRISSMAHRANNPAFCAKRRR